MTIDLDGLTPSGSLSGEDEMETALLKKMQLEAETFLVEFAWCAGIKRSFWGCGVAGVCGVFLVEILPAEPGVDTWLWIIVGDLPPAYLVTDESPTPSSALRTYIKEMREWTSAVTQGRSIEEVIPVNVPPTLENAAKLNRRLSALEELGVCI